MLRHLGRRAAATVLAAVPLAGAAWLATAAHDILAAAFCAAVLPAGLALRHLQRQARAASHRVRQLATELREAYRDPVTRLAVRAVAEAALDAAAGEQLTVALIDGDDLHGINARFGHAGGDDYLAAIARRLSGATQPGDLLARLGGDEFLLVSRRELRPVGEALRAVAGAPTVIGGEPVALRLSIGVCRVPGGDHRRAIARADAVMYTAKRAGGGVVVDTGTTIDGPAGARDAQSSGD